MLNNNHHDNPGTQANRFSSNEPETTPIFNHFTSGQPKPNPAPTPEPCRETPLQEHSAPPMRPTSKRNTRAPLASSRLAGPISLLGGTSSQNHMRYWGLLAAKLAGIAGIAWASHWILLRLLPAPILTTRLYGHNPFATDPTWAFAQFLWCLAIAGLGWAAIADQKYRCRSCCRRLRMPVATGSWDKAVLFSRPKMEWICPYGHGTMNVPQLLITGPEPTRWEEHDDMWKELELAGKR